MPPARTPGRDEPAGLVGAVLGSERVNFVEDGEHTLAFSAVAGSECGGTFLEWHEVTDHRPQRPRVDLPRQLGQRGPIGFDDEEVDTLVGRHYRYDVCPDTCRHHLVKDRATHQIKHKVDMTDVFRPLVVLNIDKLLSAELSGGRRPGSPPGSDDGRAGFPRQLDSEDAHASSCAGHEHGLAGLEVSVLEQGLPGGEAGQGNRGHFRRGTPLRPGREVAGFDRHVLGRRAIPVPVRDAEHLVADFEA